MKYQKRTVVVNAIRFYPTDQPWPEGVERYEQRRTEEVTGESNTWYGWRILTDEGWLDVRPGDFIVDTQMGTEVLRPDSFLRLYEPVDEYEQERLEHRKSPEELELAINETLRLDGR